MSSENVGLSYKPSVGIHYGFSPSTQAARSSRQTLHFPAIDLTYSLEHEPVRQWPTITNQATDPQQNFLTRWEQIKTAYAAGIGLREIARKMDIAPGTILAHAKRHGWTQQIQVATQQQSDAITPVQSVPQSIGAILSERKDRTKLGLSKYAAEAAEEAAEYRDKLGIAGKVKDVAGVHKTLWPDQPQTNQILNLAILTGAERPERVIKAREYQDSGD